MFDPLVVYIILVIAACVVFFLIRHSRKQNKIIKPTDIIKEKVRNQMSADKINQGMSDQMQDEYEIIRKKVYGASGLREERKFEAQVARNLEGIELEKVSRTDEAIPRYEQNVKEGFGGNHPYKRLVIIYRSRKQYDEEIRIIKRAMKIFPGSVEYSKRLEKAKMLKEIVGIENKVKEENP